MKIRLGAIATLVWLLVTPVAARAQIRNTALDSASASLPADSSQAARPASEQPQEMGKIDDDMSTSGFFLGIVGMLGGAAIGSQIGQSSCPAREVDKDCVGEHAYAGALIGGTFLVPIGVHIANKDRGNLPLSIAVSAVVASAFYYGLKAIPGEPVAMAPFLAAPIQVVTSIKLERRK
jgi:hypothetical protein